MTAEQFDLVVLGSGSAAREGAGRATRVYGARAALIESTRFGGSCPNVACRPTKAYLVAADLIHDVNVLAPGMGIEVSAARPDLTRIRDWKRSLQRPQESWAQVLRDAGYEVMSGAASFVDRRTVRVGDRELTGDRILIATGSTTALPAIPGIEDIDWIDHVSALELTEVPESVIVLGGGPVGLEFGQIFARFGSRVSIVNGGPHMAARSDREAAEELQRALEDEGIELVHESRARAVRCEEDGTVVLSLDPGGKELRAAKLLLASGRAINVGELDLEAAGVKYTPRAIAVDEYLRTSAEGIWAAGDVTGIQFTPIAQYQARIAVDDMFAVARAADYDYLPTAIFTDPEIAGVGLTHGAAEAAGYRVDAVVHPLRNVTRAQFIGAKHGLFKVVFDRDSRRALGVHVVSRGASDIVQGLALALKLGATVDDLALAHHAYPTYAEGVKAAAEKALATVSTVSA